MKRLNHKSKGRRPGGFTLVEMVVYIAIFSVTSTVILQLFGRVQEAELRARVSREVRENASQCLDILKNTVRQADALDGSTVFDDPQGSLVLIKNGQPVTLDTYEKEIAGQNGPLTIRKLRLTEGGNPAEDLTSDKVSLRQFTLSEPMPGSTPAMVGIELELSAANPSGDPRYDKSIEMRTAISLRKEL